MGKRTSLASLANEKVEEVPGQSRPTLVRLRPDQIAATPLNPRQNFGGNEELLELGESLRIRQLQPVVVVSRVGYLKLWPDHEDQIGDAEFVLANGERRFRASLLSELDGLDAMHREEIAESQAAFLDALLSENLDRKNFDPIEEANAVEAMVRVCGTAQAAAEQFRRHKTWVSQRRALLKLRPDLQDKVRSGELPVRIARSVAALPSDKQEAAWAAVRAQEAEDARRRAEFRRAAPAAGTKTPRPGPEAKGETTSEGQREGSASGFTAVNPEETGSPPEADAPPLAAVNPDDGQAPLPEGGAPRWDSVEWLAAMIHKRLPAEEIPRLISLLTAGIAPPRDSG